MEAEAGEKLSLSVTPTVNISCPLLVASAREVTSMTRGSGQLTPAARVPSNAAQAAEPEESSNACDSVSPTLIFQQILIFHYCFTQHCTFILPFTLQWWLLTRSKNLGIIQFPYFSCKFCFDCQDCHIYFIATCSNQKDITVLIFT